MRSVRRGYGTLQGTVYDTKDMGCYVVGYGVVASMELRVQLTRTHINEHVNSFDSHARPRQYDTFDYCNQAQEVNEARPALWRRDAERRRTLHPPTSTHLVSGSMMRCIRSHPAPFAFHSFFLFARFLALHLLRPLAPGTYSILLRLSLSWSCCLSHCPESVESVGSNSPCSVV